MDVYLDDIIIYSDSADDHVIHIKTILDMLRKESFYLSEHKMQLFASKLCILGHVVDDDGIRMDPHKVDAIEKWKIPTNMSALQAFIGAVGYLAPNLPMVRVPMGILNRLTCKDVRWNWTFTEQRAFDDITKLVGEF
jgi:hypothetical protein